MAFERVLVPWLPERILFDQEGLLVVDKPSGVPVHGGDACLREDLVSRLGDELVRRGQDAYLGVHQRLDKEASGVLLFSRTQTVNPELAREFEQHDVERTYVAGITGRLPEDHGVFEHRLEARKGGLTQVVSRGGKLAIARFRVIERAQDRAWVELKPETGRTHQLRVQLAAAGTPIVGDRMYGGAAFHRLLLHACSLRLPSLDRSFSAAIPWDFTGWLQAADQELGPRESLTQRILGAAWRRTPIAASADTYRLLNEAGDGFPGVVIDRYNDFAVLAVSSETAFDRRQELAQSVMELGARGVYLKWRPKADLRRQQPHEVAPPLPILGEAAPEELVVEEHGMRFNVRLGEGPSTGLFIDQRQNRQLVRRLACGVRVLNLFCYTGSFSVAAALGEAVEVTSVDVSGRALELARQNFALNRMDAKGHRFVKEDAIAWVGRAVRRGEPFGLIILDPPSFATRGGRGAFTVAEDYLSIARAAVQLLAPGGSLISVTNHRKTSLERLRWMIHRAAADVGRGVQQLKDLSAALDCPDGPEGPLPSKSVLLTVD